MRDLVFVLCAIANIIPESYGRKNDVLADFERLKKSMNQFPMEMMSDRWNDAQSIISAYFGHSGEVWVAELKSVFRGQSDYKKYLE